MIKTVTRYKDYEIYRSSVTTEEKRYRNGLPCRKSRYVCVYGIAGLKSHMTRPFLTTIAGCKEYINEYLDQEKERE